MIYISAYIYIFMDVVLLRFVQRILGVFQVYLHESTSEPKFIPLIRILGNISSGASWSYIYVCLSLTYPLSVTL